MKEYANNIISKSLKFADVMSVCFTLLKHSPEAELAREYLKTRIPKNFNDFLFGYFPSNNELHIYSKYAPIQNLLDLGLIYQKINFDNGQPEQVYCGVLNNQNLIMPYQNLYGDIIGFVGRRLDDSKDVSKYKNTSLTKSLNLFALSKAKESIIKKNQAIIVEGQFDCITCHRFGYTNTVALGGTAFSKYHYSILSRYTDNLLLVLDNDEAGKLQTRNIIEKYGRKTNITVANLPKEIKDIDSMLREDSLFLEKFRYNY